MKVIEASGTHYQIGMQIGEQCKEIGLQLQDQFRAAWDRKNTPVWRAIMGADKHLPYVAQFCPQYVEELSGYAHAIGVDFSEVLAWFCHTTPPKGCTDFALGPSVTLNNHTYLVHNEDYDLQEQDYLVLVTVRPKEDPAFMAMSYGGIWFNAGVNEEGIGVAGNGLSFTDRRVGIPEDVTFRKIFSARTIRDAMEFSTPPGRAGSYCNIIADDNGEMYAMEASATDFAAIHAREYLVHTNHYLHPSMQKYDTAFKYDTDRSPGIHSDSIIRYNRAVNLVEESIELGHVSAKILEDHVGYPWSICRHPDETMPEIEQSKTLWSSVTDLHDRTMSICEGNPCGGEWKEYTLC